MLLLVLDTVTEESFCGRSVVWKELNTVVLVFKFSFSCEGYVVYGTHYTDKPTLASDIFFPTLCFVFEIQGDLSAVEYYCPQVRSV